MDIFVRYGLIIGLIVLCALLVVRYLLRCTFARAVSRLLLSGGFAVILWSFYRDWTMNHSRSDWDTLVMIVLWGFAAILLFAGIMIRHSINKKERAREDSVVRHFYREEELKMEKIRLAQQERMEQQGKDRYN